MDTTNGNSQTNPQRRQVLKSLGLGSAAGLPLIARSSLYRQLLPFCIRLQRFGKENP